MKNVEGIHVMNTLSEDQIVQIVRRTVREEQEIFDERQDKEILKTLALVLKGFGIDEKQEEDIKEDFRYLRRWRKGSERVTGIGLTALVTLLVGGFASALWIGFRQMVGKG